MSDDRLEVGKRCLEKADVALQSGAIEKARSLFDMALTQFRSPDMRLGEAHALRGLAQASFVANDYVQADSQSRTAIEAYRALREQLDRLDLEDSTELTMGALEGEALALVLLSDVLMRSGLEAESVQQITLARKLFSQIEERPSAVGVWHALGRMEMRQGDYKEAENCFRRVLNIHRDTGDRRKEVSVLIQMAELHRVQLKLHRAEEALNLARSVAAHLDDPEIRGQVMVALGALHLQGLRLEKARAAYERALVVFREAENQEREGYVLIGLGEVESRSADGSALDTLVMGATLLLQSGSKQAYFGAMLRIGEHGLRIAEAGLSLVASEAARRQARQSDNVLGQGQAMRITVKALALMRESRATLLTALAREAIAGSLQANAVDVANYYRRRAPRQLVAELDALSMNEKVSHSERIVVRILGPLLHGVNTTATDLSDVERSIEIVCRLSEQLSASSNDLITDELTDDTTMVEYGDQDGLLDSDDDPPTEGTLALPEVNGSDSAAYMVVDEQETLVLHPVETDAPPIRSRESSGVVDAASLMNGDEPDTNSEEINQMLQEAGGDRPTQEGDGDDGVQ